MRVTHESKLRVQSAQHHTKQWFFRYSRLTQKPGITVTTVKSHNLSKCLLANIWPTYPECSEGQWPRSSCYCLEWEHLPEVTRCKITGPETGWMIWTLLDIVRPRKGRKRKAISLGNYPIPDQWKGGKPWESCIFLSSLRWPSDDWESSCTSQGCSQLR